MKIPAFRNRLIVDTSARDGITEMLNGGSPFSWNGSALQFEIALFFKDTLIDDFTSVTSITIELKDVNNLNGDALMSKTVLISDINDDLTDEEWEGRDEDDCHAKFLFSSAETEQDLGSAGIKQFWLVISAQRIDVEKITLGATTMLFQEDGRTGIIAPPIGGASFRLNQGYPEIKFNDFTWHRITPVISGEGRYGIDIVQAASGAEADLIGTYFRLNGYPELQYGDGSWHAFAPLLLEGRYTLDIAQADSGASFTPNADHFTIVGGSAYIEFADNSWHLIKPFKNAEGFYTIDIEQETII